MGVSNVLTKIERFILYVVVALFVVFNLPGFPSPYVVPKEIFAIIGISLFLIFWTAGAIYEGKFFFSSGRFDIPIILIMIAYLVSAIAQTPNKMEAFFFPGTVTFILISILLYFSINQFDKKSKESFLIALIISGILLSLSVFATLLDLYTKIPQLPAFMKSATFTPVGGTLPAAIYLITILPITAVLAIKDKDWARKIFFGVSGLVMVFGAAILIDHMLPGKPQSITLPTLQTSWVVAIEALKGSPVWGMGPGNYLSAFDLGRPITYNQTSLWNMRFLTASNYYFTLITEVGLAGLAALVILLLKVYKSLVKDFRERHWEELSIVLILVALAIFPSDPVLFVLLLTLLAIFSESEKKVSNISTGKVPSIITALPIWIGVIALAFFGTKAVSAEHTFQNALTYLSQNNGTMTHDTMVSATQQNPYVDRYHLSLAQVDIILANALASKKDLTDTDKKTITSLIQEAISEGKAGVSLNLGRSENWQVLAQIYAGIISFAQGADQYAIDTYNQAIALDPINPDLRITLGGIYYSLGRYDDAITSFNMAALAKPDYANAHYNLAMAYKEKKDYSNAITQMNYVLSLVKPGTPDYDLAKSTLDDLEKNKPATTTPETTHSPSNTQAQSQTLTTPPPTTTPNPAAQISLPKEATPPATPNP
jgi:tetratricopeptide (TPR) repeat protein